MKHILRQVIMTVLLAHGSLLAAAPSKCEDPDPLRFSLIPRKDPIKQFEEHRPLLRHLEKKLGRRISIVQVSSYSTVIEGLVANSIDLASMGPGSYAIARSRDDSITPFVTWTMQGGTFVKSGAHTYNSLLIVLASSNFKRIEDLRTRNISLTDPASTSGAVIPRAEFSKTIGQSLDDFAGRVSYSGSHDRSLIALSKRQVDAAFVASEHLDQAIRDGLIKVEEIRLLWESSAIPHDPFVYRGKLCPELKAKIRDAFNSDAPEMQEMLRNLKGERFVPVTDDAYRQIREVMLREQK
jgi:phosphonate transport system substrate-binding protein